MPQFDMPLRDLRQYRPERDEPADFDAFWTTALTEAGQHPLDAEFVRHHSGLSLVDVYDVRYAGFRGQRIAAWLIVPACMSEPLPTVVHYIGYTGGRGEPLEWLTTATAGYATFVMDTRGHLRADTPDPDGGANSQASGVMTRGVLDPSDYYYRRVYTDAVRAVDAAMAHECVDSTRIVVTGGSQGGGIAQAVAGLVPGLAGAMFDVPFLTGFRRAMEITDSMPYYEIVQYLSQHRGLEDQIFRTLSYFDGTNFAPRGTAPALYSVALRDMTCPPSTIFGSYNHYAGPKEITVYPFNQHEGGQFHHKRVQLEWLRDLFKPSD